MFASRLRRGVVLAAPTPRRRCRRHLGVLRRGVHHLLRHAADVDARAAVPAAVPLAARVAARTALHQRDALAVHRRAPRRRDAAAPAANNKIIEVLDRRVRGGGAAEGGGVRREWRREEGAAAEHEHPRQPRAQRFAAEMSEVLYLSVCVCSQSQ